MMNQLSREELYSVVLYYKNKKVKATKYLHTRLDALLYATRYMDVPYISAVVVISSNNQKLFMKGRTEDLW